MIHSAEVKALAAQELSRLISEPLMTNVTIGDIKIDGDRKVQFRTKDNEWVTVDMSKPIITVNDDSSPKYVDFEGLKIYGKKIKEYIDKRIDEKLSELGDSKYKVIMGESD